MNGSTKRYDTEYLQTARTYLDHGVPPESAQDAALLPHTARLRVRVTEDGWVRNILLTIAVCAGTFALAVVLGRVPVPDWMVK